MFSRWRERPHYTLGFRLAAWYAALFVGSSLAVAGLTYVLLSSSLRERDRQTVRSTLLTYATRYNEGGLAALDRAMRTDQAAGRHERLFVRVLNADQEAVFFSLPSGWSDFDLADLSRITANGPEQWVTIRSRRSASALEIASALLPDGTLVQVGRSTETRDELLAHYRKTLLAALAVIVAVGVVGGALLTRWTMRPIRHLAETVRTIVRTGSVDARVKVAGTTDALDQLSVLVNDMLDRIATLIGAMRGSLDNVAHDLRTPMTRLRATAERALQAEREPGAYRDALADCLEESERVTDMLSTLMDISEAETGVMQLSLELIGVDEALGEVVELFAEVAEDKRVALQLASPSGLIVRADRNRLRRAISNLVDNAIKYTPAGGRVDCSARAEAGEVVIEVHDTGVGISADDLPRIWDRLYRGDRSRTERGLGLGLSLVRAIIQAHGGRVAVTSEPGEGSTFSVRLPLGRPAGAAGAALSQM